MTDDNVGRLRKAELHCHLDGLVTPAMLTRLIDGGLDIDPGFLDSCRPVDSKQAWINRYEPAMDALIEQHRDLRILILDDHIRQLIEQNVVYAEIMLSGVLGLDDMGEVLDLVRRYREQADRSGGDAIQVEFVCAICRGAQDVVERKADRIMALYEAGLVRGFAIACEEDACSIESLKHVFDGLHESGMGIEIHAGEWLGPEVARDAIAWGHPHRIGHAVSAFEDHQLIDIIRERDIHLEFCPTSNLKTGSIRRIEDHPAGTARKLGLNFSINTDDPGLFGCTMNSEFSLLAETFGFTREDFSLILDNSLRSAFATPRISQPP